MEVLKLLLTIRNRTTLSYVAFTDSGERLVGDAVKPVNSNLSLFQMNDL